LLFRVSSARAQGAGDQAAVYTDALQNGWQNYGWAALNYNTHLRSLTMTKTRKQPTGPKRHALYLRCSSDDQAQGDYTTIDTQREINTRYVAEKGGVVVQVYTDEGTTGTRLERRGWRDLLRDAQARQFDAVVISYMSCLGRGNPFVIAEYELKKCGVQVEMVQEQFSDDLAGHVNKQMTLLMDGMYPKMVALWTKTKLVQMFENGYLCGHYPFGYGSYR
jgi:predicted site-specific integrase-resolvase